MLDNILHSLMRRGLHWLKKVATHCQTYSKCGLETMEKNVGMSVGSQKDLAQ